MHGKWLSVPPLLCICCCGRRYFVTWKADGTRYLMLLTREGVYLIDRSGEVSTSAAIINTCSSMQGALSLKPASCIIIQT
jgi:hypothetical protein